VNAIQREKHRAQDFTR